MSPAMEASQKYVLGLDIRSASLGWALIALDGADNPVSLIRAGVRIFEPGVDGTSLDIEQGKDQSKAVDRRTARLHRRQLRRRAARQRDLFRLLQRHAYHFIIRQRSRCAAISQLEDDKFRYCAKSLGRSFLKQKAISIAGIRPALYLGEAILFPA